MTSKTRFFTIASLLVLGVGCGAGIVAYYVGFAGHPVSRDPGPAELRYLPPDAAVVAFVDVRALTASPLWPRIERAVPVEKDGRQEVLRETGIDVQRDVDRLIVRLEPGTPAAEMSPALLLAHGTFDEAKLEAIMRARGARAEPYRHKRLLVALPSAGPFALSFLGQGVVAVGHTTLVRQAIDLDRGGDNITSNLEVMNLVRSLDSGTAWALGRFDAVRSAAKLPEEVSQLPAITWLSIVGHVSDVVDGVARAEARDEESARQLREVVRGVVAFAKLQAGSTPEFQRLVQSFQLGGSGKAVALSFSMPAQVLDRVGPPAAAADQSQHVR